MAYPFVAPTLTSLQLLKNPWAWRCETMKSKDSTAVFPVDDICVEVTFTKEACSGEHVKWQKKERKLLRQAGHEVIMGSTSFKLSRRTPS